MNARRLRATALAATALSALALSPAFAQIVPAGRPMQPGAQRPAPRNYLPEVRAIADAIAKRLEVKIVVDPTLFVGVKPAAPEANLPIDKAMDALTQVAREVGWRRVYMTQSQAATVPAADKLVDAVRALDRVEHAGIVLENPLTKKATTYLKDWSVGSNFKEDLASNQFSATPIYVLYSLRPNGGKLPMEELADLQRRSMQMMMTMDPDQMAQAMDQGIQMFMNMDPDTRTRFMGLQMQAGMKMFQNMTPDQRNQLMQQAMQAFQQSGIGGPGGAPGAGGRP